MNGRNLSANLLRQLVGIFVSLFSCGSMFAQASPPAQPQEMIIDQLKKTVVFIQTNWHDADRRPKSDVGTGFLLFVPVSELGKDDQGNQRGFNLLVTAKHMIRQKMPDKSPGPFAESVTVRFNTTSPVDASGRTWQTFDAPILDQRGDLEWFVDESDSIADVATDFVAMPAVADFKTIDPESFALKSFVTDQHVNENDEVLFAGLFSSYFGALRNYPIVRHGKLALLPNEDIALDAARPTKKTQVYLAEISSFGGNSGSPVFLRLGTLRESMSVNMSIGYSYRLLGLMEGFYSDVDAQQNSGIAVVVPVDKIQEVLSGDRAKAFVARMIADADVKKSDWTDAEAKFREAIAILEKHMADSSQMAVTLQDFATMLHQAKREKESQDTMARAQQIAASALTQPPQP